MKRNTKILKPKRVEIIKLKSYELLCSFRILSLDGCLSFLNACDSICLTLSLETPMIDPICSRVRVRPGQNFATQRQAFLSFSSTEPLNLGICKESISFRSTKKYNTNCKIIPNLSKQLLLFINQQ